MSEYKLYALLQLCCGIGIVIIGIKMLQALKEFKRFLVSGKGDERKYDRENPYSN